MVAQLQPFSDCANFLTIIRKESDYFPNINKSLYIDLRHKKPYTELDKLRIDDSNLVLF